MAPRKIACLLVLCLAALLTTHLYAQISPHIKTSKSASPPSLSAKNATLKTTQRNLQPSASSQVQYAFYTMWGKNGGVRNNNLPGNFNYVKDVFVDKAGKIYVTELKSSRLQVFAPDFSLLHVIDSSVVGLSLNSPAAVGVDSSGNIFLADSHNHRILKLTSTGQLITQWGSQGAGSGQFDYPYGLVVGKDDAVYVSDIFGHRVQKFDNDGNFILSWGSNGVGNGQFDRPEGLAADASNNIYVADRNNFRIQKFDPDGNFLMSIGSAGSGDGQFNSILGVAVDAAGNIYASDTVEARITKFDSSGAYVTKWGANGYGNGEFDQLDGIGVSQSGTVYAGDRLRNAVQEFTSDGTFVALRGTNNGQPHTGSRAGEFNEPYDVLVHKSGNVYVVDQGNSRVQVFSPLGIFISEFGTHGSGNGELDSPTHIAEDSAGNIYVVDAGNGRVQKFDAAGNFISTFGSFGASDGQFFDPRGIAVDSSGSVYVSDPIRADIQKFDSGGNFVSKFGSSGSGDGQFSYPSDLLVTKNGNILVLDISTFPLQEFDTDGNFISKLEVPGFANGGLLIGIATDVFGNILVTTIQDKVVILDSFGNLMAEVDSSGSEPGQFGYLRGIDTDSAGGFYVTEGGFEPQDHHRVQFFKRYQTSSLRVDLSPSASTGWKFKGQVDWRSSGNVAYGLIPGNYQIVFKPLSGYQTPASVSVEIGENQSISISRTYQPVTTGSGVTISPMGLPDNMKGDLRWSVDGMDDFYSAGDAVMLPAGTYTIYFAPLPGWLALPLEITVDGTNTVEITPEFYPHLITDGADFDTDGIEDIMIIDFTNGWWRSLRWQVRFGGDSYLPILGDFDGDGKSEVGAWYPKRAFWRIAGKYKIKNFGSEGDVPVPADYDGDGLTDPALYNQQTRVWTFALSSKWDRTTGEEPVIRRKKLDYEGHGLPVPGDYDGDGRDEIAIYDPETGNWYIDGMQMVKFGGSAGDLPVPADYDGDGDVDIAIANLGQGTWQVLNGEGWSFNAKDGDIPSTIDLDGDGKADLSWYRIGKSGIWFILGDKNVKSFGDENSIPLTR